MKQKITDLIVKFAYNAKAPDGNRWLGYPMIFLVFFLPLIIFAIGNYAITYDFLTSLTGNLQLLSISPAVVQADAELGKFKDFVTQLSVHPQIKDMVMKGEWEKAEGALQIFVKSSAVKDEVDRIFIADKDGFNKTASSGSQDVIGRSFAYRDWYQQVMSTGQLYVTGVYTRVSSPQINIFSVAAPIVDDNQQVLGIIAAQIRLNSINDELGKVSLPEGSTIYLIDSNGVMLKEKDAGYDTINIAGLPYVNQVLRGNKGSMASSRSYVGGKVLASYQPLLDTGWSVILERPYDKAFYQRYRLMRNQVLIYFIFLAFYGLATPFIVSAIYEGRKKDD